MKGKWTRGEKWLWAAPLLMLLGAVAVYFKERTPVLRVRLTQSFITERDTQIRSMALSGNGEILAAAGSVNGYVNGQKGWIYGKSGTIHLWNARTFEKLSPIPPVYKRDKRGFVYGFDVYALAVSPDAKYIGFSRVGENWGLYDLASRQRLWRFIQGVSDAEFSPDGKRIALSDSNQVFIVRSGDGHILTQWKRTDYANSPNITWSPDARLVAMIGASKSNNPIEIYRCDNGTFVRRIQKRQNIKQKTLPGAGEKQTPSEIAVEQHDTITSINFSPDGNRLVAASTLGSFSSNVNNREYAPIRCFDVATGKLVWQLTTADFGRADASTAAFCHARFSPDGHVVAAYQFLDSRVYLLDAKTGTILKSRRFGAGGESTLFVPPGLLFSPDGSRIYVRGKDRVWFWDWQ